MKSPVLTHLTLSGGKKDNKAIKGRGGNGEKREN